jgi:hypothetical protein
MRNLSVNEVAAACLAVKSPSACIDDLMTEVAARGATAAGSGGPHPAAVLLPAIAAGVLYARMQLVCSVGGQEMWCAVW